MVSDGRLSLGWHRRGFSNDGLFDVFVAYLFVVVLLVLFLSSLSLSMSFQILLVCFRTCFARTSLPIFRK